MNRSIALAAAIALALAGWMASGLLQAEKQPSSGSTPERAEKTRTRVQVRTLSAKRITRRVVAQGQAEANRTLTLRAETSGRIVDLPLEKGADVGDGTVLARLSMNDRRARLAEAKARVAQRKSEFDAATDLEKKGFQARNRLKEAKAQLEAARARLASIRDEIADTTVEAPFEGVLAARPVDMGDYVTAGGEIATLLDATPLKIAAHIPQQKVRRLEPGTGATVRFITGETVQGVVSFIAPAAQPETRTYRIEVEIPNAERRFRPGMSAEVRIPVGTVRAHRVSPAVFSLATDGTLGVKTVTDAGVVAFHPISVVRAETGGAWVTGIPQGARLITVGQGFVRDGEPVDAVPAGSENAIPMDRTGPAAPAAGAVTGTAG